MGLGGGLGLGLGLGFGFRLDGVAAPQVLGCLRPDARRAAAARRATARRAAHCALRREVGGDGRVARALGVLQR